MKQNLSVMLSRVVDIADAAGREIMRIYDSDFNVTEKSDRSPLTEADLAAQQLIAAGLKELDPLDGARATIHVQSTAQQPLRILSSRSHGDAVMDKALEKLRPQKRVNIGSALKFGLLAEGEGDRYVRRGATSEWDTAAGHTVVMEAGGEVTDLKGAPLRYNQRDSLINPSFLAFGDRSRKWSQELPALS